MHGVEAALAHGASFVADLSDQERFRLIAVPSVHDACDIDIDDISILENIVTRDTVADHIVDACATALGVSEVAKCGGSVSVLDGVIVSKSINLTRRYTRFNVSTQIIHQLRVESTGGAHTIALNFRKLQFAKVLQHLSLGSDAAGGYPFAGSSNLDLGKSWA